jgi:hypothetical protein
MQLVTWKTFFPWKKKAAIFGSWGIFRASKTHHGKSLEDTYRTSQHDWTDTIDNLAVQRDWKGTWRQRQLDDLRWTYPRSKEQKCSCGTKSNSQDQTKRNILAGETYCGWDCKSERRLESGKWSPSVEVCNYCETEKWLVAWSEEDIQPAASTVYAYAAFFF